MRYIAHILTPVLLTAIPALAEPPEMKMTTDIPEAVPTRSWLNNGA